MQKRTQSYNNNMFNNCQYNRLNINSWETLEKNHRKQRQLKFSGTRNSPMLWAACVAGANLWKTQFWAYTLSVKMRTWAFSEFSTVMEVLHFIFRSRMLIICFKTLPWSAHEQWEFQIEEILRCTHLNLSEGWLNDAK